MGLFYFDDLSFNNSSLEFINVPPLLKKSLSIVFVISNIEEYIIFALYSLKSLF
jgi:hypothetical protein